MPKRHHFLILLLLISPPLAANQDCVILLHGLGRTANSMEPLQQALDDVGYQTWNQDYPSTQENIDTLSREAIAPAARFCSGYATTHFVTHSLGGVLVRYYLQDHELSGRVVMLSPPNSGSEIPDLMNHLPLLGDALGPAALELGTDQTSVPVTLPPLPEATLRRIGVITGNRSSDPWFSWLIPGDDDGKVAVASARLGPESPMIEVPYGHTFLMNYRPVIDQVISFLATGHFEADSEDPADQ